MGVKIYVILFICVFIIGVAVSQLYMNFFSYEVCESNKKYDGLRTSEKTYFEAMNVTKQYDEWGDWVCVNVDGMSYERCVEVVVHECSHELFAEKCENNPKLCFDLAKELEDG